MSLGTYLLNLFVSHCFAEVMNSLTFISTSIRFVISSLSRLTKLSSAHQASVQNWMVRPLPTFQRIPCFMKDLILRMHFYTQESERLGLHAKNWSAEPYLARTCWTQKFFGWVRNFQPSLAKKAVFTTAVFRIPKPSTKEFICRGM